MWTLILQHSYRTFFSYFKRCNIKCNNYFQFWLNLWLEFIITCLGLEILMVLLNEIWYFEAFEDISKEYIALSFCIFCKIYQVFFCRQVTLVLLTNCSIKVCADKIVEGKPYWKKVGNTSVSTFFLVPKVLFFTPS